ncbi:MAG: hypothetical protein AB7F19_05770 [Candidatus Babeliales bacterium]
MFKGMSSYWFGAGIVLFFTILLCISFFTWWQQASVWQEQVIDEHITTLLGIFKRIDAECHITGFEHQKNYIDFLNVATFAGSEVGSMNLAQPHKWKGPYIKDNPTIQEKQYQIVRTHKGYFIVPGEGVELGNGKVIGKDIVFDEDADIEAMMQDEHALKFKEYKLAAPLILKSEAQVELTPKEALVVLEDPGV